MNRSLISTPARAARNRSHEWPRGACCQRANYPCPRHSFPPFYIWECTSMYNYICIYTNTHTHTQRHALICSVSVCKEIIFRATTEETLSRKSAMDENFEEQNKLPELKLGQTHKNKTLTWSSFFFFLALWNLIVILIIFMKPKIAYFFLFPFSFIFR